jgi:hypothetical protein
VAVVAWIFGVPPIEFICAKEKTVLLEWSFAEAYFTAHIYGASCI